MHGDTPPWPPDQPIHSFFVPFLTIIDKTISQHMTLERRRLPMINSDGMAVKQLCNYIETLTRSCGGRKARSDAGARHQYSNHW